MDILTNRRVLIADDEEILRQILSRFLKQAGFEPIEAKDGREAIELFRLSHPVVVVSDIMMPHMDGLTLLNEIRKIDKNAMVILMTGYGNEEILLEALRGGAVNFFKKPFNFKELIQFIESVVRHRIEPDLSFLFSKHLVEEEKYFEIPTYETNVLPVINQITLHLKKIVPDCEILNLKIGIEEMIANAVEHGNLGISFEEKHRALEEGKWGAILESRLNSDNNRNKLIKIKSILKKDTFTVKISDEGSGFDWRSLPDVSADNLLSYNGRGIFLTKIYYDEVKYNNIGNEVTLVKYKSEESDQ